MKKKLTEDYIINGWLQKYHGITVDEVSDQHPDWTHKEFYPAYPVTQEQHDDWYEWAITEIMKNTGLSRKYIKKVFAFDYLNVAPSIKS